MARDSYGRICRAGVLAVSPPDELEMPDEYMDKARAELLADNHWLAEQIAGAIDDVIAELLMSDAAPHEMYRDNEVCRRIRSCVFESIEDEAPDLAESLWMRDVEESHQDAAEYAADRD